nr:hypothetical protein GCM10020241_33730 [Streptoalloteichus tenebrarius]
MNTFGRILLGTAALGVGTLAYSAGYERRRWTLRQATLPVLAAGSQPMRVLHISDLHMTPGQESKQRWVSSLADLRPDLVVNTGDNLAHPQAVPAVLRALGPLLEFPGVFVWGSNDYYAPRPKNPARYLLPSSKTKRIHGVPLPWQDLRAAMAERGWLDLTHVRRRLTVAGQAVVAAGLDDPHLKRDRYEQIAGRPDPRAAPAAGRHPLPGAARAGRVRRGRLRPGAGRAHPRRTAPPSRVRRDRDQLRTRPEQGAGRVPVGRAHLAARLGGPGNVALCAGAVRLPAGGDPPHARAPRRKSWSGRCDGGYGGPIRCWGRLPVS